MWVEIFTSLPWVEFLRFGDDTVALDSLQDGLGNLVIEDCFLSLLYMGYVLGCREFQFRAAVIRFRFCNGVYQLVQCVFLYSVSAKQDAVRGYCIALFHGSRPRKTVRTSVCSGGAIVSQSGVQTNHVVDFCGGLIVFAVF